MSTDLIQWKKLVVEGVVIVVSILLAFAIDAWWDERQELSAAENQVQRVIAELRANIGILEQQGASLDFAIEGAKDFLQRFGPEPVPTAMSELSQLMAQIFAVPTMSLERSASAQFLSSGQLTEGGWFDIRIKLADTLSGLQTAENSSIELRQMRPAILELENNHVSGLALVGQHPLMADYPVSKFESDTRGLFADRSMESAIASYAIRMEINRDNVSNLMERYHSLVSDIEAQL